MLKVPDMKVAEFAKMIDPDEVAHIEPPHLDLHYLLSSLSILNMIQLGLNNIPVNFQKFSWRRQRANRRF